MAKSTPLAPDVASPNPNAPAMALELTPPETVTNGHTPPPGAEYGDGAPPADLNASIQGKGDGKAGWTPGFRAQTSPEKALKWARHFTQPGQDPFTTVEWELRTAGITGEDGKSVFEQTGCEIPKSWSQLATNVVVSKYFRGPLGSPQRETSVKQVIGRVADTIGDWGKSGGYFASDEDAQSFRDELAFLLVHQYGAFNSPVWFNLGVKGARAQASACFINDVYDDMESIMELAATEARLFKGGSGAGVNLWRIRSSKEQLSGGGIASGPISFMRGWDAFAGAIKSGGTTRRAAKMIILNADHPDIGEFIVAKADEEKKAWALIEAGYNGGFNVPGGAYDSVDFQNANHSVRVTDEFMRAAENGGQWQTRAVTSGKVVENKSAREMLKQIAEATWICGDPGMQFDTIINDWHTCANSDRIYASNPCCVTGDTLIGVADGRNAVAIRDLVGSEVPVYAHDHASGKTVISRMWNIEVKRRDVPVYRVTLDDGSSFRATDDHLIMLRDGSYRMVRDLEADDSLMPFHSKHQSVWDGAQWSDARSQGQLAEAEAPAMKVLAAPVERCCPVCRTNFETVAPASLFCGESCRTSPMGREMSGDATRVLNAMWQEPNASDALRAARLLLDKGIEPAFDLWSEQRQIAGGLGATRVPSAAQLPRLFESESAFREGAALWNHKVASVEFCGNEDVYDGTVDVHHNFAILTSANQSCEASQDNFSGIFIHNSEFMFLNSTACNLASLNLLKFYSMETGQFDAESYSKACETFITAQEIIVSFASYPTYKIGEMSEQYRPLGLGYANLGALLMAKGLAYDSDEGRALAGALTAIMTGAAYRKSAQIARNTGPFEGYAENREPMLRVIAKHRDAVNRIDASLVAPNVMDEARRVWDDAYMTGQKYGYRNSQASVLAPTGTISFMMDCDTTGVEPDIALVKYKKLVGGGLLKIVNQTVPAALRNLGYDEAEIKSIVEYIDKNDTIEGAPGLDDAHLPVFDCAFKAMNGTRSIHHMGHIKMMSATQPFISGAISKTCNMPQDSTADEIYDAYLQAWKMGVKAVAIYRDGSKRTQPLSTASDAQKAEKKEGEVRRAMRRKLPDERQSITHKFSIAGQEGYFMVGLYEDGSPGEIFIKMSKEGSTISGLMDSFAVAVSMCLQYGVPLRVLVNKFSHTRFEPSGYTTNRDIPIAKSLMDYIFRWFDLKFHPNGDNGHIGKAAPSNSSLFEASGSSNGNGSASANGSSSGNHGNVGNAQREIAQMQQDAPPCPDCGALTVRSGACYKCNECGATTGCG